MSQDEPLYGEQLPESQETPTEEPVEKQTISEGWDRSNRIVVDRIMSVKELRKLNPFMDDEAYIAEKQVDALRKNLKEINLKEVFLVKAANIILSVGAIFVFCSILFGNLEASIINFLIGGVFCAVPLLAGKLFKATRVWEYTAKRLEIANRMAAFGEAYRSRYALNLSKEDWQRMSKDGAITAFDGDGNEYRVVTDMDYTKDNYVIIVRVDKS